MMVLTFVTGVVDAVGFLALDRVFVGNMIGNIVILGMAVAGADDLPVLGPAIALLTFTIGALAAGVFLRRRRKEWSTAALLGQMTLTEAQASAVGEALDLPAEAVAMLQVVPYKGSLPTSVPTDPLIYRFYELINVYGTTFKELIHEEFGDGIMSAIDFRMDLQREPNEAGDRVSITMSGKFLPYKTY